MLHLDIAYITDQQFAAQCGISLTSLLSNNSELDIDVYLLNGGINDLECGKFKQICPQIHLIDIHNFLEKSSAFQNASGFQPIVYARLLLAEYLPENIDTVLYLDSDTIIDGSLENLAKIRLKKSQYVAAVPEVYMPLRTMHASIGFEKQDIYYNAGVLLVNLKQWRLERLGKYFIKYLQGRDQPLPFNDQDIINACCKGRFYTLDPTYNMNPNLPYFPVWFIKKHFQWFQVIQLEDHYTEMLHSPIIIHFMGDERPWIIGNYNYYKEKWDKYEKKSMWAGIYSKEKSKTYERMYHYLNIFTKFCPWFRVLFSNFIGINIHRWRKINSVKNVDDTYVNF